MKRTLALTALLTIAAWAGALTLQVGSPDANPEAKSLNAALVADVTACHEPAKSTVTASYIQMTQSGVHRTDLQVKQLKATGKFAVIGTIPPGAVIELTVTNPQFGNYQPRVLLRTDTRGIEWASIKHFYSTPPSDADVKAALEASID